MATKEVVDMLPGIQQTSAQAFGTLFLQLTVNDLGICLPITNTAQVRKIDCIPRLGSKHWYHSLLSIQEYGTFLLSVAIYYISQRSYKIINLKIRLLWIFKISSVVWSCLGSSLPIDFTGHTWLVVWTFSTPKECYNRFFKKIISWVISEQLIFYNNCSSVMY